MAAELLQELSQILQLCDDNKIELNVEMMEKFIDIVQVSQKFKFWNSKADLLINYRINKLKEFTNKFDERVNTEESLIIKEKTIGFLNLVLLKIEEVKCEMKKRRKFFKNKS